MRATSETLAPGSSDAATSRSFSSCDQRRRRSTDVITSAREIVIALLLGLPLGPAALASLKQDGLGRRDTKRVIGCRFLSNDSRREFDLLGTSPSLFIEDTMQECIHGQATPGCGTYLTEPSGVTFSPG